MTTKNKERKKKMDKRLREFAKSSKFLAEAIQEERKVPILECPICGLPDVHDQQGHSARLVPEIGEAHGKLYDL